MPNDKKSPLSDTNDLSRREFLASSARVSGSVAIGLAATQCAVAGALNSQRAFSFERADSLFHGHELQTLNPGYWKVENGALRRRLSNYGDRARRTGFPFHATSHGFTFETDYDPSLESGLIYLPHWYLRDNFSVEADFTYQADRPPRPGNESSAWRMHRDGYGLMGIAMGAKNLMESYGRIINAIQIGYTDDGMLRVIRKNRGQATRQSGVIDSGAAAASNPNNPDDEAVLVGKLRTGDRCKIRVDVKLGAADRSSATVTFTVNEKEFKLEFKASSKVLEGFVGIASRGMIDFQVNRLEVIPFQNEPRTIGVADCLSCYPLGDTLKQVDQEWQVRFVGMFASDGQRVEIRVSDSEEPQGGWENVPVSGVGTIANDAYRRNVAVVDVMLPKNPADATQYYTVWKDGVNVTADGRVGTDACGPGTALVGDVPGGGDYVGRLPQLKAPYKLCGLSCHAINQGLQVPDGDGFKMIGGRAEWQIRDQPSMGSYQHLEDYDFQVMVWEDDVWYMELLLYPPSTDDAYKIIALSICGPTSRWQMMRHWNTINPGDHDYGMDDIKGPEQLIMRQKSGLGQDPDYLRRNFQIVHLLTTGEELLDPTENPKKWRAWKMPNRDFTFLILDSRLWRSSQDVDVWDDAGWNAFKSLYDRTDPTRSLLGEEQFGWLQQWLTTDSSKLIGVTGVSGLHTIWTGGGVDSQKHPQKFDQRDRVVADYAGWVKAGADRVIDLFGDRDGIATVYGDVHNGCIMKNTEARLIECSFGPIGRSGGRGCIPGFGSRMEDIDGRQLEVVSLYHKSYSTPDLAPHDPKTPYYWNFLEMTFDPWATEANIEMKIRNLIDPPSQEPRGGGMLTNQIRQTGRLPSSQIPGFMTLPNADVFVSTINGQPLRGTRSDGSGNVASTALVDVTPGSRVIVNTVAGNETRSQIIETAAI